MALSKTYKEKGQSLIEVVIGLGISVLMISAATGSLFLVLRSSNANTQTQIAGSLASGLLDNLNSLAESSWSTVYNLPKNPANCIQYYLATSTGQFVPQGGQESTTVNGIVFQRYFCLDNVSRDPATQDVQAVYTASNNDPSTQKVTINVTWALPNQPGSLTVVSYLTRWNLNIAQQTDWKGGDAVAGPVTEFGDQFFSEDANVDSTTTPGSLKISGL